MVLRQRILYKIMGLPYLPLPTILVTPVLVFMQNTSLFLSVMTSMNSKRRTFMRARIVLICVSFLLVSCLSSCYTEWMPTEGIWYCQELQMQISFEENESFVVIDNLSGQHRL